jgi:hypothetical protein
VERCHSARKTAHLPSASWFSSGLGVTEPLMNKISRNLQHLTRKTVESVADLRYKNMKDYLILNENVI